MLYTILFINTVFLESVYYKMILKKLPSRHSENPSPWNYETTNYLKLQMLLRNPSYKKLTLSLRLKMSRNHQLLILFDLKSTKKKYFLKVHNFLTFNGHPRVFLVNLEELCLVWNLFIGIVWYTLIPDNLIKERP